MARTNCFLAWLHYFAGIIADPNAMTEADFERWLDAVSHYLNRLPITGSLFYY
jgi:hypothetical protein